MGRVGRGTAVSDDSEIYGSGESADSLLAADDRVADFGRYFVAQTDVGVGHRTRPGIESRRRSGGGVGLALAFLLFASLVGLGAAWASGALEHGLWWLTNTSPPTIVSAGAGDVVRGQALIDVRVQPSGRASVVEAQVDGRSLTVADPPTLDTTALQDGEHQVMVTVQDSSWRRNRAATSFSVRSDNTPPRLAVGPVPDRVTQGSTWLLRVRANEPTEVEASLGGKTLDLQSGDGFGWAVVGFPPDAQPAAVPLVVAGTDRAGNRADWQGTLQVVLGEFPRAELDVSAELLPLLGPDVRAEEDARLAATYAKVTQPRLWEGPFAMPVQGPIVTEFGEVRSYNGGPYGGHHGGVDFAAPPDRPVLAPNRGRVALVDEARLRGKLVILDHGLGVFTTYAHLSTIDVQVGQVVERSQPFAMEGSTGLSTGPHLHWEMWVGGANVDPIEWTERTVP